MVTSEICGKGRQTLVYRHPVETEAGGGWGRWRLGTPSPVPAAYLRRGTPDRLRYCSASRQSALMTTDASRRLSGHA
jgi:hypothetical protein